MKGVALTDQGKADEAIAVFRGVLADFPNCRSRATTSRSSMRRRANTRRRATSSSARSQTAPDYAVAHENLGDVYARLAAVEYEKAIDARQAQPHRGREAEADPRHAVVSEVHRARVARLHVTRARPPATSNLP